MNKYKVIAGLYLGFQILLCILKAFNVIRASWGVVMIPMWLALLAFVVLVIASIIAAIKYAIEDEDFENF